MRSVEDEFERVIFQEAAFRARMRRAGRQVEHCYEVSADDFKRIKKRIALRRREYETSLRPWRHELYAHRGLSNSSEFRDLAPDLDPAQLQKLVTFLQRVHGALWRLYYDGEPPLLRPVRYSVQRMLNLPAGDREMRSLQERLVNEAMQVLKNLRDSAK